LIIANSTLVGGAKNSKWAILAKIAQIGLLVMAEEEILPRALVLSLCPPTMRKSTIEAEGNERKILTHVTLLNSEGRVCVKSLRQMRRMIWRLRRKTNSFVVFSEVPLMESGPDLIEGLEDSAC
jgi:hypothetical protein